MVKNQKTDLIKVILSTFWNDDTNDEIKDRRIEVRDNTVLAWAWSIPTTQVAGDYYIEIDVGSDNQKIFFDVR